MNKYKIFILAALGILFCSTMSAQDQSKHEFSVWGGGGLSSLNYNTTIGDQKSNFGGIFGVGYNYFLTENYGIGTGLELSVYNAKCNFDNLSNSYYASDPDKASFLFNSTINGYEEKQTATYLNIPIMFQYQLKAGADRMFYATAGGKIGMPVSTKYKSTIANIDNRGYYSYENLEYGDEFEFLGFGAFNNQKTDEDLKLKVAYMLSVEAGMKWKLTDQLSLYTGAYFDYGLNDVNKTNANKFISYDAAKGVVNNSVITSKYLTKGKGDPFVNKVKPMAIGLKVKLALGR